MRNNQKNLPSSGTASYSPRTHELMRELDVQIINWNAPPPNHQVPRQSFLTRSRPAQHQSSANAPPVNQVSIPSFPTSSQMQPIQWPSLPPASPVHVRANRVAANFQVSTVNEAIATSTPTTYSSYSYSEKTYEKYS